jgi:hypothetical protein
MSNERKWLDNQRYELSTYETLEEMARIFKEKLEDPNWKNLYFCLSSSSYYDGDRAEPYISGSRLETQEEADDRVAKELKEQARIKAQAKSAKAAREAKEKKLLEKLKKKYEKET